MKTSRGELIAVVLVAGAGLVACGADDPGPSSTGTSPSSPTASGRRPHAEHQGESGPQDAPSGTTEGDAFSPQGFELVPPPADLGPRSAESVARERELMARDYPEQRQRVSSLRKRLSLAPEDAVLLAELGELFYAMDLPRLAERELLLAAAVDPEAGQVQLLLGDIYRARSEHGRSLWHLERARTLVPNRHEPWQLEAMVVRELGEPESAARLVDAGLAHVSGHPELLVLRARLHDDLGEPEAAEALLRQALQRKPDHLRAHLLLAQVLVQLGHEEEAGRENATHERLIMLDRAGALGLDPPLTESQRAAVLASHHNLTGRRDLAQTELSRSYELDPDNADARVVEGTLLRSDGFEREAIALFEAVLADEPDHTRALKNLSMLLLKAEDPELRDAPRALALSKRAFKLTGPDDLTALMALGLAYTENDQWVEARAILDRALAVAPGHTGVTRALEALAEREASSDD